MEEERERENVRRFMRFNIVDSLLNVVVVVVYAAEERKKEEARFSLGNINLGEDNLYLKYITVNSSCLSALFKLMNARNDSGEFKIFLNVEEKSPHASSATL